MARLVGWGLVVPLIFLFVCSLTSDGDSGVTVFCSRDIFVGFLVPDMSCVRVGGWGEGGSCSGVFVYYNRADVPLL